MSAFPSRISLAFMASSCMLAWPASGATPDSGPPLPPAKIFESVQPSVVAVETQAADGRRLAVATAISLGSGRYVSTCSFMDGSDAIRIAVHPEPVAASVHARDSRRNLCLLETAAARSAPPIAQAAIGRLPRAGERIYAVSNALGLGIGISEGVVSGIRGKDDSTLVQFTAPISPGSEGGALVDAQGRLVGVIDYRKRAGQNVNFASPIDAIAEIESHSDRDRARAELRDRAPRLLRENKVPALAALTEDWTRRFPEDAEAWIWMALVARMRGDFAAEESAWRRARERDPDSQAASFGVVAAMVRQQRFGEAREAARALLASSAEEPVAWTLLGSAQAGERELAEAEQSFRRALSLDPWQIDAHEGLIALARARGDHAAVATGWASLVRLFPQQTELRWRLVESLIAAGLGARAWTQLERLPSSMADSADALAWRARTLVSLGRPMQSVELFRESLSKSPTDPSRVWSSLGNTYHALHRLPEAIAAHREAVRLAPEMPDRRFWLAVGLKDAGHIDEAIEIDRGLVAELPQDANAWRQLGMAYGAGNRRDEAIGAMERSLELDPSQVRLWRLLIQQYHGAGRRDDVVRAHARLRTLDSAAAERSYRATIAPYERAVK